MPPAGARVPTEGEASPHDSSHNHCWLGTVFIQQAGVVIHYSLPSRRFYQHVRLMAQNATVSIFSYASARMLDESASSALMMVHYGASLQKIWRPVVRHHK